MQSETFAYPFQEQKCYASCRYYQRFCPSMAEISQPLTKLLRKEVDIDRDRGPDQEQAIQQVKNMFLSPQMLAHFNPTLETCSQTDASDFV